MPGMLTYLFCPLSKPVSPMGDAKVVKFMIIRSKRGRWREDGGDGIIVNSVQ